MTYDKISRRSMFILAAAPAATFIFPTLGYAMRFREAVINFVEENYREDIESMGKNAIDDLVRRVLPIEDEIEQAPQDLQEHVDTTWSGGTGSRRHTERCPYCISLAGNVENRAPALTQVTSRLPECFVINGAGYVVRQGGSLHRYKNGQVGPAEGYIWFTNGQYIGVGFDGERFKAEPAC
ncbi:MAG: hypothetical protein V7761_02585 [Amylibacter sp.]